MRFEIRFGNERLITPTGLAIVGLLLEKTELKKRVNKIKLTGSENPQIKNSDVIGSYIGLLAQGKTSFEDIREFHDDKEFYEDALQIKRVPSAEILRQRMDLAGKKFEQIIVEENVNMLRKTGVDLTPCIDKYIPVDLDVSPFDNSGTKKEGVSYTYKGFDGYSPMFAYLGNEGYLVNAELREGKEHCQKNTDVFLRDTLVYAKKLTTNALIVRMDSGNDSVDNLKICYAEETLSDFIIKRNLRSEKLQFWHTIATEDKKGNCIEPREGKKVYTGSVYWNIKELGRKVRVVYQVTERTIKADGQMLMFPDLEVQTWWTSLGNTEDEIIGLYKAHATCEQFHSEIKTDMDGERLPSGKFDTNALVLSLIMIAYNILRIMGQESLKKDDVAIRKSVKRRRLRTVIQNLICLASHVVTHARKDYLSLGRCNVWRFAFRRLYEEFA